MRIETVGGREAFRALREEWNALLDRSDTENVYLRHEFLDAWWEGFAGEAEMRVLLGREGDRLVAAIPLLLGRRTLARLPVRALHLFGSNLVHPDFAADRGTPGACAELLDAALSSPGYHVLILKGIPDGSDHDREVRAALARAGARYEIRPEDEIYLDARGGPEAFRKARGTKLYSNIRNRTKKLQKLGDLAFERHRGPGPAIEEAFAVSTRSWKGDEGSATGVKEGFRTCYGNLVESGAADLFLLRCGGKAVAYRLGFARARRWVELDIAYDKEYSAGSPGTILSDHANEALLEEGIEEIVLGFDFPWKQEWKPERRRRNEFIAFRPRSLYPKLVGAVQAIRRRIERSRKRPDAAPQAAPDPGE